MKKIVRQWISEAEEQWLESLEDLIAGTFRSVFLPSHDQSHHARVWKNCKLLLEESADGAVPPDRKLVGNLIHACWFHDAGMALNPGPEHGEMGSRMYRQFIDPYDADCANAIRDHDDKTALQYRSLGVDEQAGILDYLSVADDLDALGLTGIYRYAEICLTRGIGETELPASILKNARHRYLNLVKSCRALPPLLEKIESGYGILRDFYTNPTAAGKNIISLIGKLSLGQKIRPENFHRYREEEFFLDLHNELCPENLL